MSALTTSANPLRTVADQLGRLSVSIPARATTGGVRLMHQKKKRTDIAPSWEEGHGEKIWIHTNFMSGLTVYSHSPVIKANRALRQIPFNGKKLKPAKIRKDFWRPLALIQFPDGLGHVGRSVFHIMREFRVAHQTAWDDSLLRDPATGRTLTKHERGARLNDQKANSIADIAAVLGGAGKGNKVYVPMAEGGANVVEAGSGAATTTTSSADATAAPAPADEETKAAQFGLVKATIFWADELDKNYAVSWPANVTHEVFRNAVPVLREAGDAQGDENVAAQSAGVADPALTQTARGQEIKTP